MMSSTDRLTAFREHNSQLNELRQQSERLRRVGDTHHTGGTAHGSGEHADSIGFIKGSRRPLRTNPTKHAVSFAADLTSNQTMASQSREGEVMNGDTALSRLIIHVQRCIQIAGMAHCSNSVQCFDDDFTVNCPPLSRNGQHNEISAILSVNKPPTPRHDRDMERVSTNFCFVVLLYH